MQTTEPRVGSQLAPNHVRPLWPDGAPQQIHLDLWVDDPVDAHERVMSLDARVLKPRSGRLRQRALGTLRSVASALWWPTFFALVERMATSWSRALARNAPTVQLARPPSWLNGS